MTLEEYEAQRKAKMSSLIGKKTARAVEEIKGEKIERIETDYFAVRVLLIMQVLLLGWRLQEQG